MTNNDSEIERDHTNLSPQTKANPDQVISEVANNVNQDKINTVCRVVHNRENPFVQLNKKALWDTNLSLKAVGLWARCLSRPDNWTFSIAELVKHCKEGRRSIDAAMKELIDSGYVCRIEYHEKDTQGKFVPGRGGVQYIFFEFAATEEEKQEQLDIFKKSFQHCGFGDSRFGNSRNAHLLIKSTKETDSKEIENSSLKVTAEDQAPSGAMPAKAGEKKKDFTPEVIAVAAEMNAILKTHEPDYSPPANLAPFRAQVDFMLRIDKREAQKIYDVLNWALSDSFWRSHLYKPNPAKYLREKFMQLKVKMETKPPERKIDRKGFAPCSDDAKAIEEMKEMGRRAL